MTVVNTLIREIDNAIFRGDLDTARERYKQLVRAVGADTTRDGWTEDFRRQRMTLERLERAEKVASFKH